jgi:hypothetical protein
MGAVADLLFIGAPTDDPIRTATFIGGLVLTRRQKAALLKDYLQEKGLILSPELKRAAGNYVEAL